MILMKNFLSWIVSYNFYPAKNTHLHFSCLSMCMVSINFEIRSDFSLEKKTTPNYGTRLTPIMILI